MQGKEGFTADLVSSVEEMACSSCLPLVGGVFVGGANNSTHAGECHYLADDDHVQLIMCQSTGLVAAGTIVLPTELIAALVGTATAFLQEVI